MAKASEAQSRPRPAAAGLDSDSPLGARLRAHKVRVRADGPDAVILLDVPANRRFFNKPGTNVMVRRARASLPYLIAVDQDLEYTGSDPVLLKAFAGGTTQQGWRILFIDSRTASPFAVVVEDALRAVGFDDEEPEWPPALGSGLETTAGGGLVARFGREVQAPAETPDRRMREVVEQAAAALIARHRKAPVFAGPSGVGKSHALACLAARLPALVPGTRLVSLDLAQLFLGTLLDPERENLVAAVIEEAAADGHLVLVLERLELLLAETRHGAAALARAVENDGRFAGTMGASTVSLDDSPLERHVHAITLEEASVEDACLIVRAELPRLAAHHGVSVADELIRPIAERASTLAGHLPSTALSLADMACARARLEGREEVGIAQIYVAARSFRAHEER